jgi:hypothetical protein
MANLEQIAEQQAIWDADGQKVSGLVSDRVIKRKFTQINSLYLKELAEELRLRVSVKNPKDNKKYYTVLNPMVNGIEYPGVWRGTLVETFEDTRETGKIVQTLRYGWAQTLIDAEARLVGGDNIPLQPERLLIRQYVALDFTKLGTMIDGIETTKYITDPIIEGKTYTGRYRILSSKPERAADGSGIITQALGKNLVMTPDALPAAILVEGERALLSPFAHDTTSEKNTYIYEYRWIDPDYVLTLRNAVILLAGVIDARAIKTNDGSFNLQVLTQTNTWEGNLAQKWEYHNRFHSFAAEQIINTYSHIPLASLAGFRAILETPDSGYKVSSLADVTHEQGFGGLIQTQDKLFVGTVSASNGILINERYWQLIQSGVIRTTLWLGVPDADLVTAMATVSIAPSGYKVLQVLNDYNGTGSFNLTRVMKTEISDVGTDVVTWNEYGDLETISVQSLQQGPDADGVNDKYIAYNYVYQTIYVHSIQYFKTAAEAASWIEAVNTSVIADDPNANLFSSGLKTQYDKNYGSSFHQSGDFEWLGHKVTITHSLRYTFRYDDPSL